ncbi:MAG: porin [Vibrio sp.]
MKKTVISTAILSALISSSAFAANVYKDGTTELNISGRAEARFNASSNNEYKSYTDEIIIGNKIIKENRERKNGNKFDDLSRARLSVTGRTEISSSLYGFGKYENEVTKDSDLEARYIFAGIGTEIGEFSYGKQDTAQVMITDFTDIMATFGADADAALSINGSSDKQDGNFSYKGEFGNLTLGSNYVAENDEDFNQYGIAALYAFDFGLTLAAGYAGGEAYDYDVNQINIGAKYNISHFTFGALYQWVDIGDDIDEQNDGFELSAMYNLNHWTFAAVYNYATYNDGEDEAVNNLAAEAVYVFNPNLQVYAGYKFDFIDEGYRHDDNNQFQAGIRYDF